MLFNKDLQPDGSVCFYCGVAMIDNAGHHPLTKTREHIRLKSKGGTRAQENIVLVHNRCNGTRGQDSFKKLLKNLPQWFIREQVEKLLNHTTPRKEVVVKKALAGKRIITVEVDGVYVGPNSTCKRTIESTGSINHRGKVEVSPPKVLGKIEFPKERVRVVKVKKTPVTPPPKVQKCSKANISVCDGQFFIKRFKVTQSFHEETAIV